MSDFVCKSRPIRPILSQYLNHIKPAIVVGDWLLAAASNVLVRITVQKSL